MFGDDKTLARDLEALRIERQTEQGVTLHEQQVPWRHVDRARRHLPEELLRAAFESPRTAAQIAVPAEYQIHEVAAVGKNLRIAMRRFEP